MSNMNTKTLAEYKNITLQELNRLSESERRIFDSLSSQFQSKQYITEKQNDLLIKILKRDFDLSNIDTIKYNKMFLYKSYFYRTDYNGDYLQDSEYVLSPVELEQEQISNLVASQYNYSCTVDKYQFEKMVAVPESIKGLNNYARYYMFKYEKLIMKLKRARSSESKYKIIKAIKTILSEEYNEELISEVLDRKYWK